MRKSIMIVLATATALFAIAASHPGKAYGQKGDGGTTSMLKQIQSTLDTEVIPRIDAIETRTPITSLPCTISSSGSYYLTSDLITSGDGIIVNADNVTINLMGFSMINSGTEQYYGVFMAGRKNIQIENGTITRFMAAGIFEANNHEFPKPGIGHRILGVRIAENGVGISLPGFGHVVKGCTAAKNSSYKLHIGKSSTVTGNVCYANGDDGISAYYGCTITANTCYGNGAIGIQAEGSGCTIMENTTYGNWVGISAIEGCTVMYNTSQDNTTYGIHVRNQCFVKNNTLRGNNQNNIVVEQYGNVIEENVVTGSPNGINFIAGGNFYANNRASGNGTNYANTTGNTDGGGNVSF